jgi:3-oxoacyl-[acyl-carrier protein] reductase
MTQSLQDQVVIVIGAGRGIGRAIALELASRGARLMLASRTPAELDESAGLLRALGAPCRTLATDVSRACEVEELARTTLVEFGRIDALVNNAGTQGPIGPLAANDAARWMRTLEVNLMGPMLSMRSVLPHMIGRRQGKIVNLSGGGATAPRPNFSAYAASKAALVRLTETVSEEVRPFNVQVNAVAPGAVNTRMIEEIIAAGEAAGAELDAAQRRLAEGGSSPYAVAKLIAWLLSAESGTLSGKLISALHDDWRGWTEAELARLSARPWLALRRIDRHTLGAFVTEMTPTPAGHGND